MGNPIIATRAPGVRVVASDSTWIEGEALRQLHATAALPGMVDAVGMPDIQPGKHGPSGAAFLSRDLIRPALVGSDIGCGMALWQTRLPLRPIDPARLADRLDGLDRPWDGDVAAWLSARGVAPTPYDASAGTPGSGNHFVEFQAVHEVRDAAAAERIGLEPDRAVVLVHSGSRGLGEAILRAHAARHGDAPLRADGPEGEAYLAEHDRAVAWARASRELAAVRAMEAAGTDGRELLDVCHNAVVPSPGGCGCHLHRKGAAPADRGPVVVPGSRGDVSVLVEPVEGRADALWSLAHGAGRKIARHEARGKLRGRYRRDDLLRNPFGGVVVCGDDRLLWEEAPPAYKDAGAVVGDLVEAGLVRVVAVMRPLVTFKCSREPGGPSRKDRRERMDARRAARSAKLGGRA